MVSFRQMRSRVGVDGFHSHHLIPKQVAAHRHFAQFIGNLRAKGLELDDFGENGMHLPYSERMAEVFQLPVHRGAHPQYNAMVSYHVAKLMSLPTYDALLGIRLLQVNLRIGLRCSGYSLASQPRNPMCIDLENDMDAIGLLGDRRARILRLS